MQIKKTALYEQHQHLGAKIVEFAGYYMPVQYSGIINEHQRVRKSVGMFDVSHMGEFVISGDKAFEFLQYITINDVSRLVVNRAQYTAMCKEDGGMIDDLILYRRENDYLMIVNASNIDKDWQWVYDHRIDGVELHNRSDELSLIAVQGPKAEATLKKLTDEDLSAIDFYWSTIGRLADVEMTIARTGYTGEPGFELLIPNPDAEAVWKAIMDAGAEFDIAAAGLGARDTLRLEMGYCLYGNDMDETTHPLEAGLGWITKLKKGDFIGRQAIADAKEKGLERKLVGFEVKEKSVPRHGFRILHSGVAIGYVTSGSYSPMLEHNIGMGYVDIDHKEEGTPIDIEIRNRSVAATVVKPPFYKPQK